MDESPLKINTKYENAMFLPLLTSHIILNDIICDVNGFYKTKYFFIFTLIFNIQAGFSCGEKWSGNKLHTFFIGNSVA